MKEKSQELDMFKAFKAEVERINSTKELKLSNLTVVVNTMENMTDLVNNVQVHLLNT